MAYQAFRENGFPTYYGPNQTPWKADILGAGLIFAFVILAISFFVILPGRRGKEKIFSFVRVSLSLLIGGVIVLTNYSYTWETSEIHTRTKYKAGSGEEISANIGVYVGLRGINITLKGSPDQRQLNETIDYNEQFIWAWQQGRLGYGPFAGRFNQEYRAAQFRGLPLPILWVAEYFTLDGEGIRWGRHYRQAGWYTHIILWLCFPLWILTNVLFLILLRYGAYLLAFTGLCMVTANILWASIRNFVPLEIPWPSGRMEFSYGGSFYMCLITGVCSILLGVVIIVLDLRFPNQTVTFFGADVLQDSDDVTQENTEDEAGEILPRRNNRVPVERIEMTELDSGTAGGGAGMRSNVGRPLMPPSVAARSRDPDEDDIDDYSTAIRGRNERRKSRTLGRRLQKRRRRPPPPPPSLAATSDDAAYVNTRFAAGSRDVHISMQ